MASRRSTARKILGRHGSSRQRDSSRASAAFRLRIGRPSRWPRLSHRTVAKTSTRLGSSSLEVRVLSTPAALQASLHASCVMPSRWDCQPALQLSSKCGCSCSPQLIPHIGATLAEWTVLSHLIESDLPFATLMLTHSDAYPRCLCDHASVSARSQAV